MPLAILKSKPAIIAGIAVLVIGLFYLGRETVRKRQIQAEISSLENEIAAISGKNKEILDLISYYKSVEYKERQARSLLNLQKPGEFAVALPGDPEQKSEEAGGRGQSYQSNLNLWWNYFFGE